MGEKSGVSWTDASNGPWRGCRKVSAGCARCYAAEAAKRFGWDFSTVKRASDKTFYAPLKWEAQRIFVCPESDFFIEEADEWRDDYWENVIRKCHTSTFIIPTKRPENIAARLPKDWGQGWPWVWLGVSVEDQATADERIPLLWETPAAHRWVSAEPLLEMIDFRPGDPPSAIDWLVIGGESGPKFRPCDPAWVARAVRQADAAGVKVWVKQDSHRYPGRQGRIPDALWARKALGWVMP